MVGDIDNNGVVGFGDFIILSNNYGATGAWGAHGDIDNNQVVGFSDFVLLANNFGGRTANVPEPSSVLLLLGLAYVQRYAVISRELTPAVEISIELWKAVLSPASFAECRG